MRKMLPEGIAWVTDDSAIQSPSGSSELLKGVG